MICLFLPLVSVSTQKVNSVVQTAYCKVHAQDGSHEFGKSLYLYYNKVYPMELLGCNKNYLPIKPDLL